MDPITASLNLVIQLIQLYIVQLEGGDPPTRAEIARLQLDTIKRVHEFFDKLFPPGKDAPK